MYIEGLGYASVANGVLRIETVIRNARGEDVPGEDLLMPMGRVAAILEAMQNLIGQLRQQEAQASSDEQPSVERMVY
jgi:hypothetical protein